MPAIEVITVGPLETNAYLVRDPGSGDAVLIDPGSEAPRLIAAIEATGARLRSIWLTHAHFDHIGAVAAVRERFQVPVFIHELDIPLFVLGPQQAAAWGLEIEGDRVPDQRLHDGDEMECGSLRFQVMHTPGHSPGHTAFVGHGVAFVGDCLFAGSIGRTDLPFASPADMNDSLIRLASLPAETRVMPGHGPATTVQVERSANPFLQTLGNGGKR